MQASVDASDGFSDEDDVNFVIAIMVSLPMTMDEFTGHTRSSFKKAIVETAQVQGANVQIVNIIAITQRQSEGIEIDLTVAAGDGMSALSIVRKLTVDKINAQMSKVGLPNILIVSTIQIH